MKKLLTVLALLWPSLALAQPAVIIPGPIPSVTANCTLQRNAGNTDWTCTAASAASQPLTDSSGLIADNVDASKVLFLQLSGLTTATNRTWTIPDANITFPSTIASLAANTFTALQTMNGGLAATTGTFSSTLGVTGVATFTAVPVFSSGITEASITDGTLLARLAANETVTGAYNFTNTVTLGNGSTSYPRFYMYGKTGVEAATMVFRMDTTTAERFQIVSGEGAGSDFVINRSSDGANYVEALRISRAAGTLAWGGGSAISSSSNVALLTGAAFSGNVSAASGLAFQWPTGTYPISMSGNTSNGVLTITAPGSVQVAGNLNVTSAGVFSVAGFGTHSFSASGAGAQQVTILNNHASGTETGDYARLLIASKSGSGRLILTSYSSAFTTAGIAAADSGVIVNDQPGGLSLGATDASGDVRLYSRNALALTLGASQAATFTGTIRRQGVSGRYLDVVVDSADAYIDASHGLLFRTNGISALTAALTISASQAATFTGAVSTVGSITAGTPAARGTTAGTNRVDIFNGTAPAGTLTNGISLYSTTGELYVMDAAGNATLLSPHDQTENWVFRSENAVSGKYVRIEVEQLLKRLNSLYGEPEWFVDSTDQTPASVAFAARLEGERAENRKRVTQDAAKADKDKAEQAVREAAKAKQDAADKAEADKKAAADAVVRAAQERRQAIRVSLQQCDVDNAIIVAQGGKPFSCAITTEQKAELTAMQNEAKAAKVKADAESAERAKQELADCTRKNVLIVKQGGKPIVCGVPQPVIVR